MGLTVFKILFLEIFKEPVINLSIPMQKTCEYENMDGPYCNPAAKNLLNGMRAKEDEVENPIWKDLKKFKDLEG